MSDPVSRAVPVRVFDESGFTLIELLIVMSIIGILSALGLTSFWVMQERAEYAKGQTTMGSAITAFEVGDQGACVESGRGSEFRGAVKEDVG